MTPRLRLLLIVPGALFLVAFLAFEFGWRKGRDQPARPLSTPPPASGEVTDAELVKLLLAQDLGQRRFPFADIVAAATGHQVIPVSEAGEGLPVIQAAIEAAATDCLVIFSGPESPLKDLRRINEASTYFETSLRALIHAHDDLSCSIPTTGDGTEQRSGYPDLRIEHEPTGLVVYLDPKLFEKKNRASSLRTFYYTPKTSSSKIREDAVHFLLGFAHDGKDGAWTFSGWDLVDLSKLEVGLKAEFQASNRELYPAKP